MGPNRFILEGDSVDVWVLFRDRGFESSQALEDALLRAERSLSLRAADRRAKMRRGSLVTESDLPVNAEFVRQILDVGGRFRTVSRTINGLSVRLPRILLEKVAKFPFVAKIQPVAKGWRYEPQTEWIEGMGETPNQMDETDRLNYGNSLNQLNQINVVAAHDAGWTGLGVLVGMLDTGFYRPHQALVNQPVIAQYDFIQGDTTVINQTGDDPNQHNHGTYTWSTLGGAYSGSLYGPAYQSQFILGKTESVAFEQPVEEDWYVAGMEWEDSLGVAVISTSLGYLDWYQFSNMNGLTAVTTICVNQTVANGVVCVTANGNENGSSWDHIIAPSDAFAVIACGAVNSTGTIASFSSHGPTYDGRIKPEVCARGVSTWCATPTSISSYSGVSGTSLSTPLVGGACALVVQAHPTWTPIQIRAALMNTADNHTSPDNIYGWGVIDVMAAIAYNFPPNILVQNPQAGPLVVPTDSIVNFSVIVMDSLGGSLTYHWWIDENELVAGPDSTFRYRWQQADTSVVKCVVINEEGGSDSTDWDVQVYMPLGVVNPELAAPQEFALHNPHPNPFNPSTTLRYQVSAFSHVNLKVYDTAGRLVSTLVDNWQPAGTHQVNFDASSLAAGVYLARMTAGDFTATQKLVLVK
jgi:subtilisin family serine protease